MHFFNLQFYQVYGVEPILENIIVSFEEKIKKKDVKIGLHQLKAGKGEQPHKGRSLSSV